MDLKEWQKFKDSCKYSEYIRDKGTWCKKFDIKCSHLNCKIDNPPSLISNGNNNSKKVCINKNRGNDLTSRETQALKLFNKPLSYAKIGEKLGISKKNAWKLVNKAKKKLSIKDRGNDKLLGVTVKRKRGVTVKQHKVNLHNDSISIECKANLDVVEGDLKELKYTSYKLIKSDNLIIKVFEKKLVIQFRKDIEALTVEECYKKASKRIERYINSFFIPGVWINKEFKQLSRHYAIIGTDIAKKYIKEGKKLFIYDKYDGKERVRIDFSDKDKAGGLPHFEFTHPEKSKDDTDANKKYIESIINNPHYLPHEVKGILDIVLSTQKEYAYQIKRHLEVQEETLKTLKLMQKGLK